MKMIRTIIIMVFVFGTISAQSKELQFEHITTLQGLSDSKAKCIFQDSNGYLWFGTFGGGLIKYDGYTFRTYKHKREDKTSISNNTIQSIAEDREGNLWIGTGDGISQYIRNEDKFKSYNLREFRNVFNVSINAVYEVFTDSKSRVWVGTAELGTLRYDENADKFIIVHKQIDDSLSTYPWGSSDFTEDQNGVIWATSTTDGLLRYDLKDNVFHPVKIENKGNKFEGVLYPFRIYADSKNRIWIMTSTDLYKYSKSTQRIVHLLNYEIASPLNSGYEGEFWEDAEGNMWVVHINLPHPIQFPKLSDAYIEVDSPKINATDIYIDSFGTLWISDWDDGLYKNIPKRQSFHETNLNTGNNRSNNQLWISTICQSVIDTNVLYLGTNDPGWLSYNKISGNIVRHHAENKEQYIDETRMIANSDGTVWISYWGEGLIKWNPLNNEFKHIFNDSLNSPNLHNARIASLLKDEHNRLWIGTYDGLLKLSADESVLDSILVTQGVIALCLNKNMLWIGTYGAGLIKYDIKKDITVPIRNINRLKNLVIFDIHIEQDGILWLATEEGLIRFDPESEEIKVYDESDGLASNIIARILPGDNGDLWISTSNGISHFHKDLSNHISAANYDTRDGLTTIDFRFTNALKAKNGRFYFGGKRLTFFTPQKIKSIPPRIHLTDLSINGKSLQKANYSLLEDLINENKGLELNSDQNTISISFNALHTAEPGKNKVSYYLEGYDADWQNDNKRHTQYLNLKPNTYKFHLLGNNQDGIWSEELILPIIINPPFWKTWWAYLLYLLTGILLLYSIRKFELKRQIKNATIKESQLRAEAAELQAKAAEAQARLIQAENERKTQELEEARQLQLSMLPKKIPSLPNLDISVYMKTATEVGGDYYDFQVDDDGSLIVALGDATGHGMQAGTLVTLVKGLFTSEASNKEILKFFNDASKTIKEINLGRLLMAFSLLKIKGNKLEFSSAGLPPMYIYRSGARKVEEIDMQGMPLGAMKNFGYKLYEAELNEGDCLLLLSDGYPELTNSENEQLGYERLVSQFAENAERKPEEIIEHFKSSASEWANGKDPDDDVTFVVIKVK